MGPARDESDETIFEPDPSFERVVSGPDPVLDPGFRYDFERTNFFSFFFFFFL